MFNVGFPELFVVGLVALLVFGPERLPELARNAAKLINRFRGEASRSIADLRASADLGGIEDEVRSIRSDLTGVRKDITRSLRGPSDARATKDVSPGGPTGTVEEDVAGPPPFDPEAT